MEKKKKSLGRPPKPLSEQKSVMFQIRMTEDERALLDDIPGAASAWASEVLIKAAIKESKKNRPSDH